MIVGSSGCGDDGGVGPGDLRFGWIGTVTVTLVTPLRGAAEIGEGELVETLQWRSDGLWSLRQHISYEGSVGDLTEENRAAFGAGYSTQITRVNDVDGLQLVDIPEDSLAVAACGDNQSMISVSIYDDPRDEVRTWTQCARGFGLSGLATQDAGPKPEAARLVEAAIFARDETIGRGYVSAYNGSVPFRTVQRGEDTPAEPNAPLSIRDDDQWRSFWVDHTGSAAAEPPDVDFSVDQVIVAAVGEQEEAGINVVVRRILQVGDGTLVHIVKRVPGDFCSPVARRQFPYHIVVAPITDEPVRFADIQTESVSCGG